MAGDRADADLHVGCGCWRMMVHIRTRLLRCGQMSSPTFPGTSIRASSACWRKCKARSHGGSDTHRLGKPGERHSADTVRHPAAQERREVPVLVRICADMRRYAQICAGAFVDFSSARSFHAEPALPVTRPTAISSQRILRVPMCSCIKCCHFNGLQAYIGSIRSLSGCDPGAIAVIPAKSLSSPVAESRLRDSGAGRASYCQCRVWSQRPPSRRSSPLASSSTLNR